MSTSVSLMDLHKMGAHRGNKASKLNPKLKKAVYGTNNGLSLIDLAYLQTVLEHTESFLEKLGTAGKQILLVGTSKHVTELTKKIALEIGGGMPYVDNRWLGGTLTNWATVKKTLKTLEKNESIIANEKFFRELSRNEQLILTRETEKLRKIFGGLVNLKSNKPSALVVLDASENTVAIEEAVLMHIPVISLANTGTTTIPGSLEFTLVCNNNSTTLVSVLMDRLVAAYNKGASTPLTTTITTH